MFQIRSFVIRFVLAGLLATSLAMVCHAQVGQDITPQGSALSLPTYVCTDLVLTQLEETGPISAYGLRKGMLLGVRDALANGQCNVVPGGTLKTRKAAFALMSTPKEEQEAALELPSSPEWPDAQRIIGISFSLTLSTFGRSGGLLGPQGGIAASQQRATLTLNGMIRVGDGTGKPVRSVPIKAIRIDLAQGIDVEIVANSSNNILRILRLGQVGISYSEAKAGGVAKSLNDAFYCVGVQAADCAAKS